MSAIKSRDVAPAQIVLLALLVAGVAVRIVVMASWWPASMNIPDSGAYGYYASEDPLGNPQHPAGYSVLLASLGLFTRSLPVFIIAQQLAGIASALLLYGAVKRLTGSPWPALVPAAVILLGADQIFLEHTIMSEAPFLLFLAGSLYASARFLDGSAHRFRWLAGAAALLAGACVIRTAGMAMIPVLVLGVLLADARQESWRPALLAGGVAVSLLVGYAAVNHAANGRFEVGPSVGWQTYGRTAQIADCSQFNPPDGTSVLCERTPPRDRLGQSHYLFEPQSPARRYFGALGENDRKVGAFGRAVIVHQPMTFARLVWRDLRTYWVPGAHPLTRKTNGDLAAVLDFDLDIPPQRLHATSSAAEYFFDPIKTSRHNGAISRLTDYQHVFRFGAIALSICTLLIAIGLFVGERRARIGVLLLGVGGLSMLIPSVLLVSYSGRYTVPCAGPVSAGAAIAVWSLWHLRRGRAVT